MTTNKRRLMFGFFALIFVVAFPPIILYSRGYRLAFSPVRLLRTGTLALASHPKGAEIWVDGKDTGKETPDAIGGLKAGRYRVEVRKEGHTTWAKTLEVFPDLQTWASQIVLLSTRLPLRPVVQGRVLDFTLSLDGSRCAFRTDVSSGLLQTMQLDDGEGGSASPLADLSFLGNPARHELEDFQWSPDSKKLLFAARLARRWSEKTGARTYLLSDLDARSTSPLPLHPVASVPTATSAPEPSATGAPAATFGVSPGEVESRTTVAEPKAPEKPQSAEPVPDAIPPSPPGSISPGAAAWLDSDSLVVYSRGALHQVVLPGGEAKPLELGELALAYTVAPDGRVLYLSAQGPTLRRYSVSDGAKEDLMRIEETDLGQPSGDLDEPAATLTVLPHDQVLLLMRNGLLFVLDPVEKALHHVAEGVETASLSPDGKKLAYMSRYGVGVYYLDVMDTEPRKLPGSRAAITRSESRITGYRWHRFAEQILYAAGDVVVMAELDDRDDRNSPTVASSAGALWGLDYDSKRDILYLKRSRSKDPEGIFSVKLTPEGIPLLPLP